MGSRQLSPRSLSLVLGGVIATAALVVHSAASGFGFVNLDDQTYVYANAKVLRGLTWDGLAWAFSSVHGSNWHPLTWLSHMADVEFFGLEPGRHHLVSVLLHAVNSVLVFAWLRRATGSVWRSALVGVLFAVHPLHVESVAWVSERKDVLSTFFWLAAMFAYLEWERHRDRTHYVILVLAFSLGLLSKPMVVTLPFALVLVDAWPLGRLGGLDEEDPFSWRRLVPLLQEKLPLFALSFGAALVTWMAQKGSAAVRLADIPFRDRLGNAVVAYVVYVEKVFWPSRLAAFYPHPSIAGSSLDWTQVALSAAAILAIGLLAYRTRKTRPYLGWGWAWFLGTLLPVIGIVQVGLQSHADRYTYIPSIGILVAVAWLLGSWAEGSRGVRAALVAISGAAVLALGIQAREQVQTWRTSETLWRHALEVTENNWQAWTGLGDALFESGRPAEAMEAHTRSIAIRPGNASAWNGLGVSLGQLGLHADAIDRFQQAIRLDPGYADAWYNLGTAHGNVGEHRSAAQALERAAALVPEDPRYWANLAVARSALGDRQGAAEAYSRLQALDPAKAAEMRRP